MADFEIKDLRASVEGKEILKGVTLAINKGSRESTFWPLKITSPPSTV